MSNWLHFSIEINKDSKVSVRRAVEEIWGKGECCVSEDSTYQNGIIMWRTFNVGVCCDGVEQLTNLNELLQNIKLIDNKSNPNIRVTNLVLY